MTFDEFIKNETQDEKDISEKKRIMREEWLNNLRKLYDTLIGFLEEYIQRGEVKIDEEDISVSEEFLGIYTAERIIVHLGNLGKRVELTPVGRCVIAAFGRVDMSGKNGTVRIVLVDSKLDRPRINGTVNVNDSLDDTKPELEWRFVTAPPNIKYIPIRRETFLEQLMLLS